MYLLAFWLFLAICQEAQPINFYRIELLSDGSYDTSDNTIVIPKSKLAGSCWLETDFGMKALELDEQQKKKISEILKKRKAETTNRTPVSGESTSRKVFGIKRTGTLESVLLPDQIDLLKRYTARADLGNLGIYDWLTSLQSRQLVTITPAEKRRFRAACGDVLNEIPKQREGIRKEFESDILNLVSKVKVGEDLGYRVLLSDWVIAEIEHLCSGKSNEQAVTRKSDLIDFCCESVSITWDARFGVWFREEKPRPVAGAVLLVREFVLEHPELGLTSNEDISSMVNFKSRIRDELKTIREEYQEARKIAGHVFAVNQKKSMIEVFENEIKSDLYELIGGKSRSQLREIFAEKQAEGVGLVVLLLRGELDARLNIPSSDKENLREKVLDITRTAKKRLIELEEKGLKRCIEVLDPPNRDVIENLLGERPDFLAPSSFLFKKILSTTNSRRQ